MAIVLSNFRIICFEIRQFAKKWLGTTIMCQDLLLGPLRRTWTRISLPFYPDLDLRWLENIEVWDRAARRRAYSVGTQASVVWASNGWPLIGLYMRKLVVCVVRRKWDWNATWEPTWKCIHSKTCLCLQLIVSSDLSEADIGMDLSGRLALTLLLYLNWATSWENLF